MLPWKGPLIVGKRNADRVGTVREVAAIERNGVIDELPDQQQAVFWSMGEQLEERTLRRRCWEELVVEEVERFFKITASVSPAGLLLLGQNGCGQLRELRWCSLSERASKLQDAADGILVVSALPQESQILRSERTVRRRAGPRPSPFAGV